MLHKAIKVPVLPIPALQCTITGLLGNYFLIDNILSTKFPIVTHSSSLGTLRSGHPLN